MHPGNLENDGFTPKIPYLITRSDFEKLYPVYQKMALALVETGKVQIIDTIQPLTESSAFRPSTDPGPHKGAIAIKASSEAVGFGGSPSSSERCDTGNPHNLVTHLAPLPMQGGGGGAPHGAPPLGSYNISHTEREEQALIEC